MKRRDLENSAPLMWLIILIDICVMNVCMMASYYFLSWYSPSTIAGVNLNLYMIVASLTYLPLAFNVPPILLGRVVHPDQIIQRCVKLTVLHVLGFSGLLFMVKDTAIARTLIITFFLLFTVLLVIERMCMRKVVRFSRLKGRNLQNVILVGNCEALRDVVDYMHNKEYGFQIMGIFTDEYDERIGVPCIGTQRDVVSYLHQHEEISEVYATMSNLNKTEILDIYRFCENNVVRFYALPAVLNVLRRNMVVTQMGSSMMLSSRPEPLRDMGNRMLKRLVDVVISSVFLLTLFPIIYVIVAIIIKRQSPGPVLFAQKRSGLNGSEFNCLKFRSMHVNEDSDRLQATADDPRKFSFGDFMRKTNIDELPQFINVLMGDMSVVGPRPHMLLHTEEYSRIINKYMVRHWVKPGVTGWAQVQGFRGETRELSQMEDRVHADIWYVENWTFWLDMRIIIWTLFNTVAHNEKNAY